jgi:hypothetical protein
MELPAADRDRDYGIGLACILVGLVLLIWPRLRASV